MKVRIIDKDNITIDNPDLSKGYLQQERLFVKHHKAVAGTEGKGRYKTIKTYPNGGKDVEWEWDVPPVAAQAAWDEYEDVQRYIEYSAENIAEMEAERVMQEEMRKLPDRLAALEKGFATLQKLLEKMGVN